jgi:flagellar motor protein MotB
MSFAGRMGGLALALLLAGCAGGQHLAARSQLDEMNRTRTSAAAKEAEALAPQAFARAEEARRLATQADAAGDDTGAALQAERAIAAYAHAFALARLARARREEDDANAQLAKAADDARQLGSAREAADREGDDLDKQVKVAREALAPPPSGPADPQREAARLVAARALETQARLLCGAAHLLSPEVAGLADAEKTLDDLEKTLSGTPRPAPIDPAARARATCLSILSKIRRETGGATGQGDALLAELSAAAGWDPMRDERGVVVTLRAAFKGTDLVPAAESKLGELGRVAAAHPAFGVQLVVHDAEAPSDKERTLDRARADACVKALVGGGAAAAKVRAELAGARAPVVDPEDTARRARNARVEIVFVPPGS